MKIVEQNVELIDYMGSDLSVVNAARVSFAKESDWELTPELLEDDGWAKSLSEKDQKLINYLARHNHWTPFGHVTLSYRVKSPIFVARQLVKHQVGLVWNEVSRRYVDDEPEFWLPGKDNWRHRAENAKQGSGEKGAKMLIPEINHEDLWGDHDNEHDPDLHVSFAMTHCLDVYNQMLKGGVAPEQARIVLPQNTMTEWIWTGSLAAFARVCNLRICAHAQAETREVAQKIFDLVPKEFEHSWKALTKSCDGDCG